MRSLHWLVLCGLSGCYAGSRAATDVNAAWRGHTRVELDARLGQPVVVPEPDGTLLARWTRTGENVSLPSANGGLSVTPTSFEFHGQATPGVIEKYKYDVATAITDPQGRVLEFASGSIAAGIPGGMNLRTGAVFGVYAAAGALSDARSPLPSMGLYIGGMIGPQTALVGTYSFVNGHDPAGTAMAHATGFAVQYWPDARVNVRGGVALVLDLEPGLKNAALSPGAVGAVSYAFVRAGSLVIDVRFDATLSTSVAFGTLGVGVNVN